MNTKTRMEIYRFMLRMTALDTILTDDLARGYFWIILVSFLLYLVQSFRRSL